MIKEELAKQAIESVKACITETKFIVVRQEYEESDSEFIPKVEKAYNEHKNQAPSIVWKLDENQNLLAIITYIQIKEI